MAQPTTYIDFADGPAAKPSMRARLDAERYYDRGIMEREWQTIWTKSWLLAGLASDVAEPGDYFVFSIGHESILISHTDAGNIQAMYNACQHRGNRVVGNANDLGSGRRTTTDRHTDLGCTESRKSDHM